MGRHHYPAPQQWFEVGHAEVHPAGVGNSLPQDALKRAQWSWFPHQYFLDTDFPTGWAELSWKPTVFPWGGVGNPATPSWVQFLSFLRLNNAVPTADTLAPRDPSGPWTVELIYGLCHTHPPDVRGSQGHGTWVWGREGEEGKGGRGAGPGVLCYCQPDCHNSSTVASWAGWVMGFHRAVNHFPGSHVLLPVLKRLRFPSRRSDGKLGEGGGGQVLETFSGGIPNRIPLKCDPGREVDAVQLTSGPRCCAGARTNSCIEDSWAISSGHPHWECFLLPGQEGGREAPCARLCSSQVLAGSPDTRTACACTGALARGIHFRHGGVQAP